MLADRDAIHNLLRQGFPQPDDFPEIGDPCPENFGDLLMQGAAYAAVNVNDKRHRDDMRMFVIEHLLAGSPLTIAERAWIIYVLSALGDMPHESKGAPMRGDDLAMFRCTLACFVVGDERSNPGRKVTERLRAAAEILSASYEKVRAAYYAKDFRPMCTRLEDRGIIDRVLNGKTVAD